MWHFVACCAWKRLGNTGNSDGSYRFARRSLLYPEEPGDRVLLSPPARGVSGCVNSAFLNHFHTLYGSFVQYMDAQLGARQGRRPPTIHHDRAQRTISADSLVVA